MYFRHILKHTRSTHPMSTVNPNLQTLMSLVDELQEQMPEGKYLEAMNALRDLHEGRVRPAPWVVPAGRVQLTNDEYNQYEAMQRRRRLAVIPEVLTAYRRITALRVACATVAGIESEEQWVTYTGDRDPIIKNALTVMYELEIKAYNRAKNPKAIHCPFMARNADGKWYKPNLALVDSGGHDRCRWDCLCGSKNILCKNWRQHEVSDKHTTWVAGGRQVTKTKTKMMKEKVSGEGIGNEGNHGNHYTEELFGQRINWVQHYHKCRPQNRNEWTNPSLFAGKPLDWVPAELPDPVPVYVRGPCTMLPTIMPVEYAPLPNLTWHSQGGAKTLTEEEYARFISIVDPVD